MTTELDMIDKLVKEEMEWVVVKPPVVRPPSFTVCLNRELRRLSMSRDQLITLLKSVNENSTNPSNPD